MLRWGVFGVAVGGVGLSGAGLLDCGGDFVVVLLVGFE